MGAAPDAVAESRVARPGRLALGLLLLEGYLYLALIVAAFLAALALLAWGFATRRVAIALPGLFVGLPVLTATAVAIRSLLFRVPDAEGVPVERDDEPEDGDAAAARMYEWATFLAPTDLAVRRGQGYSATDLTDGRLYHVREPDAPPGMRPKDLFVAALFPLAEDEHFAGGGAFSFHPQRKIEHGTFRDVDLAERPLLIEQALFDATTDWIDDLDEDDVRHAYEVFRHDLAERRLPSLAQLRKRIRSADEPAQLLTLASDATWRTMEESRLFLAFVQRIWNTTPRTELGGKTPEEAAAADPF